MVIEQALMRSMNNRWTDMGLRNWQVSMHTMAAAYASMRDMECHIVNVSDELIGLSDA